MQSISSDRQFRANRMIVSERELLAYVEGSLGPVRSEAVEGFLAVNPDLAAHVMRLRHQRARLQTAGGARLSGYAVARPARTLAAWCLVCTLSGWLLAEGMDDDGAFRDLSLVPEYVDDAIQSLRVAQLRGAMASQPETTILDAAEIERVAKIRVPQLPLEWKLIDAQVFPSEEGPSVHVVMEAAPGQRMTLFAVRADTMAGGSPALTSEDGRYAAYWENDGIAYVLSGAGTQGELLARAGELSRSAHL